MVTEPLPPASLRLLPPLPASGSFLDSLIKVVLLLVRAMLMFVWCMT